MDDRVYVPRHVCIRPSSKPAGRSPKLFTIMPTYLLEPTVDHEKTSDSMGRSSRYAVTLFALLSCSGRGTSSLLSVVLTTYILCTVGRRISRVGFDSIDFLVVFSVICLVRQGRQQGENREACCRGYLVLERGEGTSQGAILAHEVEGGDVCRRSSEDVVVRPR
ncbi:hypothetical protein BU24DRAFT_100714 [Aaosphaeria arxii CBS 175.79]|uniref:Uncharacterized protein n=1 Tax=Aaosphaeria arxii CBS 175.79 TaxID=1450172 RepID=A0A6A5Y1C1_9PLEO|nr:uncharacterized protein BU24DRAFT_100714 [Aaosphaeria arxii CBS 175.79]KAF2018610.1 hypothetical protein BU24DRAFT_100714 [Aaosphaeria arxii CBS 175.79]